MCEFEILHVVTSPLGLRNHMINCWVLGSSNKSSLSCASEILLIHLLATDMASILITAIASMPFPKFALDTDMMRMLVESEKVNKVVKLNAGSSQENVRHPRELVEKVNTLVAPKFRDALILTHDNSELLQLNFELQKSWHLAVPILSP